MLNAEFVSTLFCSFDFKLTPFGCLDATLRTVCRSSHSGKESIKGFDARSAAPPEQDSFQNYSATTTRPPAKKRCQIWPVGKKWGCFVKHHNLFILQIDHWKGSKIGFDSARIAQAVAPLAANRFLSHEASNQCVTEIEWYVKPPS